MKANSDSFQVNDDWITASRTLKCLYGDRVGHFYCCNDHRDGTFKKSRLVFIKLDNIELSNNVLGNILNICPFLEDLRLVDWFDRNLQREILISYPQLKFLVIDNHVNFSILDEEDVENELYVGH